MNMRETGTALVAGVLFGLGFLDITGAWDPTLLFVLGGAVGVTVIAFRFVLRLPHPLLSSTFYLPTTTAIDWPLIAGAAIFGVGWGIAGYCPGPGIVAIVLGIWNPLLFLLAFAAGSLACRYLKIGLLKG